MNQPIDMTQFVAAKSNQLNADDLIGGPRVITVTGVKADPTSAEQPVDIHFEGDNGKPFKPCKSMRRVILGVWGKHAADYVGRSMAIYRDASVTWGGMEVGGIRISHMSHIDKTIALALQASNKGKKMYKIEPLIMERVGDAAAEWAAGHIKAIEAATDLDALKAVEASNPKAVAKLAKGRPELHGEITGALAKCYAAFGVAETTTPENPTAAEGPADEDRGEQSAPDKADLLKRIQAAPTVIDLGDIDAEFRAHKDWSDEDFTAIDDAMTDRAKFLRKPKETN